MRPAPYCTPRMQRMLANMAAGLPDADGFKDGPTADKARSALASRGWVKNGKVTEAGHKFLQGLKK